MKCECLARMSHDQALKWSHNLMDSPIIDATATRLVAEDIFQKYSGGFKQKGKFCAIYKPFVSMLHI